MTCSMLSLWNLEPTARYKSLAPKDARTSNRPSNMLMHENAQLLYSVWNFKQWHIQLGTAMSFFTALLCHHMLGNHYVPLFQNSSMPVYFVLKRRKLDFIRKSLISCHPPKRLPFPVWRSRREKKEKLVFGAFSLEYESSVKLERKWKRKLEVERGIAFQFSVSSFL